MLVVDVPRDKGDTIDVELGHDVPVQVHDDDDVEKAARQGYISGPCDCFLTIWAILGDVADGGADQIVGILLLPLVGALYYLTSSSMKTTRPDSTEGESYEDLFDYIATSHPVIYLAVDLGGLFLIGLLVLFEADLHRLYKDLRLRWRGYTPLEGADTPAKPGARAHGTKPWRMMREQTLRRELHKAIDATEELELQMRVRRGSVDAVTVGEAAAADAADGASTSPVGAMIGAQLQEQQERKEKLAFALQRNTSHSSLSPNSSSAQLLRERKHSCWSRCMSSTLVAVFQRSLNGLVTVWLYFADVISDIQVMFLLHKAGRLYYASVAAALLVLQFIVVWQRVLPYLRTTFGRDSLIHRFFLWFGFPLGMIGLDMLMFLEPFGLLPIVPLPERMRQFIPAYKSTRIVAEVLIESLPQCLLQSYIFVTVMSHAAAGVASPSELLLLRASIDGSTFIHILPRSIAISTITTLKAFIEMVLSAREAGISVRTKVSPTSPLIPPLTFPYPHPIPCGLPDPLVLSTCSPQFVQLLHVGFGLPLDALKKGTIVEWSCTYSLADGEVPPLIDALIKNSSLTRLHLGGAGLEWNGPEASKERSGAPLVEAMAADPHVLEALGSFVVSTESGFEIPVAQLRKGGDEGLRALRETKLFSRGGPRRVEILLMSDLLRRNRRKTTASDSDVEESAKKTMALIEDAQRGGVRVDEWEARVTALMAEGHTRRAHMKNLLRAAVLRDVGFGVRTLLAADLTPDELHDGGFPARALRLEAGFSLQQLSELGYSPAELKAAGWGARDLKSLGLYTAASLRDAEFGAAEMRNAHFSLTELRDAGYPVAELKVEAGFAVSELRAAGVHATDLRASQVCTATELRDAGFPAGAMKEAGYELRVLHAAGYKADQATKGGWALKQLLKAGYEPDALRKAGHTASDMRAAGFELAALTRAGYQAAELQAAGFDTAKLKEEGINLFQLKQANTPVAALKEAGYKADRLKLQGYTAGQLAQGGFTPKDLRGFRDQLYVDASTSTGEVYAGYTAKELREGKTGFTAAELTAGGYLAAELREGGYAASELKAKGYGVVQLHGGGYSAAELHQAGFQPAELKSCGHTAATLCDVGLSARELLDVGYDTAALRKAGVGAAELIEAGCTPAELKAGGFSARKLTAGGVGLPELVKVGFGVSDLRGIGSTVKALRALGFSAELLQGGGFDLREVEASGGASAEELRGNGYTAKEMNKIGFDASALKAGGYTCKELKDGGFDGRALLASGFKARSVEAVDGRHASALRNSGYTCKELKAVGFGVQELFKGGFSAKELREVGCTCDELRAVGGSGAALRDAGFSMKQMRAAGFSLRDLREAGASWNELVIFLRATHAELLRAGYAATEIDPKSSKIFREYAPK